MKKKLKTLSEIVYPEGAIYNKFQLFLNNWKEAYKKRNNSEDKSVIEFIEHFGEIKNSSKELNAPEKI